MASFAVLRVYRVRRNAALTAIVRPNPYRHENSKVEGDPS